MTIYQTFYDPEHLRKLATGESTDCGLDTLDEVEAMMGAPLKRDERGRYLLYPDGVCFSTVRFA